MSTFSSATILRISKLVNLLSSNSAPGSPLTESETIGYEKCLMYIIQISGLSNEEAIKDYFNRDNSVSAKKNPFNYYLSFNRFKEG